MNIFGRKVFDFDLKKVFYSFFIIVTQLQKKAHQTPYKHGQMGSSQITYFKNNN